MFIVQLRVLSGEMLFDVVRRMNVHDGLKLRVVVAGGMRVGVAVGDNSI